MIEIFTASKWTFHSYAFTKLYAHMVGSHDSFLAFGPLSNDPEVDITMPKLVYSLLNVASLAIPAYKANSMGLWPSTADFLLGETFDPV